MSWRLPGFPLLLRPLVPRDTHLSCPRNRHSRIFLLSRRVPRRDTTTACGRVMRARRHHALSQDRSHEAMCPYHPARRISPEKLAAKLRLLSSAIARVPGIRVHSCLPAAHVGVVQLVSGCTAELHREFPTEKIRRKLDFRQLQLLET